MVAGIEATGSMQWFLELLDELGIECRGRPSAAKIRAAETRKQKHDRRDARLILDLLTKGDFPAIWMPSTEQRDLRTLLRDSHQLETRATVNIKPARQLRPSCHPALGPIRARVHAPSRISAAAVRGVRRTSLHDSLYFSTAAVQVSSIFAFQYERSSPASGSSWFRILSVYSRPCADVRVLFTGRL